MLRGIINYYHKFENRSMRCIWNQLNARLLKWVKWEKGLYKYAAIRWLKTKYKESPKNLPIGDWYILKGILSLCDLQTWRAPVCDGTGCVKGDFHARFCGKAGVKFLCLTRLATSCKFGFPEQKSTHFKKLLFEILPKGKSSSKTKWTSLWLEACSLQLLETC